MFVDTSVWYAAADAGDASNARAKRILADARRLVTSDHVLVESWILLRHRLGSAAAGRFWDGLRAGVARVETVGVVDLEAAWGIQDRFADQGFSIVDCTSFAVMQRLGIRRAASFDAHFAIFRFGRTLDQSFEVMR